MKRLKSYIFDYHYLGKTTKNGELEHLWEEAALNQSIKLWIASFKGDAIRSPARGGYVNQWLMKHISEDDKDQVAMTIRDGLFQDFEPHLEVEVLEVTPNLEGRYWEIYMEVYSPTLKVKTSVSERIKAGL